MKKKYAAVFGHYDSRGGTMAAILDKLTVKAVYKAFERYDREFGYHPKGKPEEGLEDWDAIIGPDVPRVSEEDFLWVAEIHYPDDCPMEGDLAEGFGDGKWDVIIDEATEPKVSQNAIEDKDRVKIDYLIRRCIEFPTQIEVIGLTDDWDADLEKIEKDSERMIKEEMDAARPPTGDWRTHNIVRGFNTRDTPEIIAIRKKFETKIEELEQERTSRKQMLAKVVKTGVPGRWDDDAYGFWVLR